MSDNGKSQGLHLCLCCHNVVNNLMDKATQHCTVCGKKIHDRKPLSFQRTWALTLLSALLYIPANTLPIMSVEQFGRGAPDTIFSGVICLIDNQMYSIAILVFLFSIVVPLFKIGGLFILLVGAKKKNRTYALFYVKLYRFLEWIGRWSMLDILIIGLLVSLVQFGYFGVVEVKAGAIAFAAVVIATMTATIQFDPRMLWD